MPTSARTFRACARVLAAASLAAAAILPLPARAFENFPEFTTLSEYENSVIENPMTIDSEYGPLVLSYQKPMNWEYLWLSHTLSFDGSVGSIDGSHFLMDTRLKLSHFVAENLEFRMTVFQEQDSERNSSFQIFEFIYWASRRWGFSLYGEPYYFKRNNNLGLALLFKPSERHEIRIFNTFTNLVRNDRNDLTDTFIVPDVPDAFGFVGRLWSDPRGHDHNFLEYAARYETFTRWAIPAELRNYAFWKKFASLYAQKYFEPDAYYDVRVQFDQKYESNEPSDPSSPVLPEAVRTDRLQSIFRTTFSGLGPANRWTLTPGLALNARTWYTDLGPVTYVDFMPHAVWTLPGFDRSLGRDTWTLEYDFTWHRESGPNAIRATPGVQDVLLDRLDVSYDFAFRENASLRLMGTVDMDRILKNKPWGGGDVQLRTDF